MHTGFKLVSYGIHTFRVGQNHTYYIYGGYMVLLAGKLPNIIYLKYAVYM